QVLLASRAAPSRSPTMTPTPSRSRTDRRVADAVTGSTGTATDTRSASKERSRPPSNDNSDSLCARALPGSGVAHHIRLCLEVYYRDTKLLQGQRRMSTGQMPSSARMAPSSAATGDGTAISAMARSGSFKPWPVSVQTTVDPAGTPTLTNPATDAALAGSQNTDSVAARNRYASRISSSVTA